jgi:hypothetical protein
VIESRYSDRSDTTPRWSSLRIDECDECDEWRVHARILTTPSVPVVSTDGVKPPSPPTVPPNNLNTTEAEERMASSPSAHIHDATDRSPSRPKGAWSALGRDGACVRRCQWRFRRFPASPRPRTSPHPTHCVWMDAGRDVGRTRCSGERRGGSGEGRGSFAAHWCVDAGGRVCRCAGGRWRGPVEGSGGRSARRR